MPWNAFTCICPEFFLFKRHQPELPLALVNTKTNLFNVGCNFYQWKITCKDVLDQKGASWEGVFPKNLIKNIQELMTYCCIFLFSSRRWFSFWCYPSHHRGIIKLWNWCWYSGFLWILIYGLVHQIVKGMRQLQPEKSFRGFTKNCSSKGKSHRTAFVYHLCI